MASLSNGRKTVAAAGTAVVIGTSEGVSSVALTALSTNTGIVVVGGKGVIAAAGTRTGVALSAGQSVSVPCDDIADIYVDAVTSGEGVSWLAASEV